MFTENRYLPEGTYFYIDPDLYEITGKKPPSSPVIMQIGKVEKLNDLGFICRVEGNALGTGWLIDIYQGPLTKEVLDLWTMLGYDCSMLIGKSRRQ